MFAALLGREHAGPRPLADERSFKLCKCCHHVEYEPAAG